MNWPDLLAVVKQLPKPKNSLAVFFTLPICVGMAFQQQFASVVAMLVALLLLFCLASPPAKRNRDA